MDVLKRLVFVLCLLPGAVFGGEAPTFRVQLVVHGTDDILVAVESYLSRELRALGDVIQTDENPVYMLAIRAKPSTSQDGVMRGYAISTVILEYVDMDWVSQVSDIDEANLVRDVFKGSVRPLYHWLSFSPPSELEDMCQSMIIHFNSKVLKSARALAAKPFNPDDYDLSEIFDTSPIKITKP